MLFMKVYKFFYINIANTISIGNMKIFRFNKILKRLGEITTVDSRLKELVYESINKAIEKNK